MQEVCIPLPRITARQTAEVIVNLAGWSQKMNYRLEAFNWADYNGNRIARLRNQIESYDRNWELVQIFNPKPSDQAILVMFRQRQT